ncbi:MAG TPA: aminotransferase class III-fold pyridoxal phosphate-dependent enzyme, partial [Chitinophagaceae bacterium]
FRNAYHGSTQGALSIIGDEYWRNAFRPLLPGIDHYAYNDPAVLGNITHQTACVIMETVQGEAGVIQPAPAWIKAVRERCTAVGALLVFDEIQAGFGRTGELWGFMNFDVIPDIIVLGKAIGGGMPLGAFATDRALMNLFSDNPVLGHITTFGGHPVSCAAGLAAFNALLSGAIVEDVRRKEEIFLDQLQHPSIRSIRSCGLWMAVEFESFEFNRKVIDRCITEGVFVDWFLFASNCMRISPPLTITDEEIMHACKVILAAIP